MPLRLKWVSNGRPYKAKPTKPRGRLGLPISVAPKDLLMLRHTLHTLRWQIGGQPTPKMLAAARHNLLELRKLVEDMLKRGRKQAFVSVNPHS